MPRPILATSAARFEHQFFLLQVGLSKLLPASERYCPGTPTGDALILSLLPKLGPEGDQERMEAAERTLKRIGSPLHPRRLEKVRAVLKEEARRAGHSEQEELARRAIHALFVERTSVVLKETLASYTVREVNQGAADRAFRRVLDQEIARDLDPSGSWMRDDGLEESADAAATEPTASTAPRLNWVEARLTFEALAKKAGLSDMERRIWEMKTERWTHPEIGQRLDISAGTSRVYLSKAKKKLQTAAENAL